MKNPQGERWRKLDNTGKVFPVIASQRLSNVFRISATLKEDVDPELLRQALVQVLPQFECFQVKLRRGFFWYYFETNKRTPMVEREATYPCKYIERHSNNFYQFRVSYYGKRINLEVFHAITDGLGAANFLKALVYQYLDLKKGLPPGRREAAGPPKAAGVNAEDSYLKNYKKISKRKYSTKRAFRLTGKHLPLDESSILHGYLGLKALKAKSKAHGASITKYLLACLIYAIYKECLHQEPCQAHIGISLPINLRAFFGSQTMANFFAVTMINFLSQSRKHTFEEILGEVDRQMEANITREKMEETISYNVSTERKWYVRSAPLVVKWAALNWIFWRSDQAYTMTLSNIGLIQAEPKYQADIEGFYMLIGVSRRQPIKCGVCAYNRQVVVTFTSVFSDTRLQDGFFGFLRSQGIPVEVEGNGTPTARDDKGAYPKVQYDPDKWKKMVNLFYLVLLAVAGVLGVVNYATYAGSPWSVVAIGSMVYVALTVKYSIMRHANLAYKIILQTLAAGLLLVALDYSLGYTGWSVNYAIPTTLLFADVGVVFLILINRMNWQSYFMYQIAITIFSLVPLALWAAGLVTRPAMAVAVGIVTVLVLAITILLGDRSVKTELKRRFHL